MLLMATWSGLAARLARLVTPVRQVQLDTRARQAQLDTRARQAQLDTRARQAQLDTPERQAQLDTPEQPARTISLRPQQPMELGILRATVPLFLSNLLLAWVLRTSRVRCWLAMAARAQR